MLEGAWAVVSGAGSGLGRAVTVAVAARGGRVLALDRDVAGVPAAAGVEAVACDIAEAAAVEAAFARVDGAPLRLAVSCAGVAPAGLLVGRSGPHDPELFGRTLAVNLVGTFHVMRLAAARMAEAEPTRCGDRGVIVNTASIAADDGQVGQCAYAASKGGVAAMTLPAARELARHAIRVVAVAPGVFGTPMMAGMPDAVRDGLAASVPYPKRMGDPEEFAALVLHIVDNGYLNGTVIRFDAGLRMGA